MRWRRRCSALPGTAPAMVRTARSGAASSCASTRTAGAASRICGAFGCLAARRQSASRAARRSGCFSRRSAKRDWRCAISRRSPRSRPASARCWARCARAVNAPWCSSVGRLFDAFAALCGLRQRTSYEGQAAAELEGAADRGPGDRCYEFAVRPAAADGVLIVDWQPALEAALADLRGGMTAGAIAAALHRGLAAAIVAVARGIGERRVALTGGCFQNVRLTEAAVAALRKAGHEPLWHRRVPPNDGGLALGQAAWAAWFERRGEKPCA